jgi:hypothetical protein
MTERCSITISRVLFFSLLHRFFEPLLIAVYYTVLNYVVARSVNEYHIDIAIVIFFLASYIFGWMSTARARHGITFNLLRDSILDWGFISYTLSHG